jgi:hypothetical protein
MTYLLGEIFMKLRNLYHLYPYLLFSLTLFLATLVLALPAKAQEARPQYLPMIIKSGAQTGGTPGGGGGGGTVPPGTTANAFDVTVSLYNAPTGDQRTAYEQNMRYFADSVYEMSNGAHKIRRISIYSGGQFADRANIVWIQSCHPNAHVSSYGRGGGTRIQMCDDFQGTSFIADDNAHQGGGYTIGHEWGHYFYGLYDEYQGSTAFNPADVGAPASTDVGVPNSIMNSQWQAVSNAGTADFSWLNFSTELNNGASGQNAHRRVFQASGWTVLVRPPSQDPPNAEGITRLYYPELANAGPAAGQTPSLQLPDARTEARSQLQIIWMGDTPGAASLANSAVTTSGSVMVIVIEKSSSMNTNERLLTAQDAVAQVIEDTEIGDSIGLIAFDSQVSGVQPITQITGQATKDTLINALYNITAGDSGAATGNAARQALDALSGSGIPADFNQGVFLITDGPVTTGENLDFVIDSYIDNFAVLYAFGYGVDSATANRLAGVEDTGGEFRFIDDSDPDAAFEDLLDAFDNAREGLSPVVDVNIQTGTTTVTSGSPYTTTFPVDSTLGEIEVEIFYQGPPTATAISILDPILQPVSTDPSDCKALGSGPSVDTICNFIVGLPMTGTWTLQLEAISGSIDFGYWIGGLTNGDEFYDAEVEVFPGEYVNLNDPIVLDAFVFSEELPITDIVVTAQIEKPDGSISAVSLTDDGVAPDEMAQDGFYSGQFNGTDQAGDYYIIVTFDNSSGAANYTEFGVQLALKPGQTQVRAPLAPYSVGEAFERFAELQVYVESSGP